MAENPANGGAPERLELQKRWTPPANPLDAIRDRAVPGVNPQGFAPPQVEQEEAEDTQTGEFEQPEVPEVKGNPYARLRVVERDAKRKAAENEELRRKLDTLLEAVAGKLGSSGEEEVEEEEPLNPVEGMLRKQDKILDRLESLEQQDKEKEEKQELTKAEVTANTQIKSFMEQANGYAPKLYENAMAHLANAKMIEVMDDNDTFTEEEAAQAVAEWVFDLKMKALNRGENPGEVLFRRATALGFDANSYVGKAKQPAAPAKPPVVPPNPVEQLAQEAKRKQGLGSISSMSGVTAQDPLKGLAALSEKDRVRAIYAHMDGNNSMRRRKPPTLEDLLKHKRVG